MASWTHYYANHLEDELSDVRRQLADAATSSGKWRDSAEERWALFVACRSENGLLESQLKQSNELLSAAQRDLAEARNIVWLLIDHAKALQARDINPGLSGPWLWEKAAWDALPRWLRKEIER